MINIMLIGCGPHAKRIHIPIVNSKINNLDVKIDTIVDLESQKETIDKYLKKNNFKINNLIFINNHEQIIKKNKISKELKIKLNDIVQKIK